MKSVFFKIDDFNAIKQTFTRKKTDFNFFYQLLNKVFST